MQRDEPFCGRNIEFYLNIDSQIMFRSLLTNLESFMFLFTLNYLSLIMHSHLIRTPT